MYRKDEAQRIFDSIADRYDLLNRVLSFGVDKGWRRTLVRSCSVSPGTRILDVATGTGDILDAFAPGGQGQLVGIDVSGRMLKRATERFTEGRVSFVQASALSLPFRDGAFDIATAAFGIRNFSDRPRGLSELKRVLRKEGTLHILEFTQPEGVILRSLFLPYFRYVLPLLGGLVSGDRNAYKYLYETVMDFPTALAFEHELEASGFSELRHTHLTGGIATLFTARRP